MGRQSDRIYLDHNATTPLAPEVLSAMTDVLAHAAGNPSSTHSEGAEARSLIEGARRQIADALATGDAEIIFTAGATEANNTVYHGLSSDPRGLGHVVITAIEHPSVLEPAAAFEAAGGRVTRVAVDSDGRLCPDQLSEAIGDETRLVSVILANNETGVVQDMAAIAAVVADSPARLHIDATQAVGKWPMEVSRLGADYLSLSAHKLNGPKGSGCLVVRKGAPVVALLRGGPQEKGLRGGTENVAGIVGLGVACEVAHRDLGERMKKYETLRDTLWRRIHAGIPQARWNGRREFVLTNTLNIELPGLEGDAVLQALDVEGIAASAGAACHSGSVSPSHVLVAMGRSFDEARASLRFSTGEGLDESDMDRAADILLRIVGRVAGDMGHA